LAESVTKWEAGKLTATRALRGTRVSLQLGRMLNLDTALNDAPG